MEKERILNYFVTIVLAVSLGGCAYDSASRIPMAESEQAVSAERQIERQPEIVLPTFPMGAKFRCPGIDLIISKVEVLLEEDGTVVAQPYLKNRCGGRGSGTANFLFEASGGCAAVVQPYGFNIGPGEEIRMFSALGFCNERVDPPVSVGNTFTVTADYDDEIEEFNEGNNSCVVLVRHDETSWWTYDCLVH